MVDYNKVVDTEKKRILKVITSHPEYQVSQKEVTEITSVREQKIEKLVEDNVLTYYKFKYLSNSEYPTRYLGFTKEGIKMMINEDIKFSKVNKDSVEELWNASRPGYPNDIQDLIQEYDDTPYKKEDYDRQLYRHH